MKPRATRHPQPATRILITNDDGIHADGLIVLERIARQLSDDVWVVAPEHEQSGASHSLSIHSPVRVRKYGPKRFSVDGTPTDCVLLALQEIMPKKSPPSLILSGINRGSNVGDDITYSGTVAAAMEGTVLGVKSIALSQLFDDREDISYAVTEAMALPLIKQLLKAGWPEQSLINLNFPSCAVSKVKGIKVCPQGKRRVRVALTGRIDPKGRPYFWIGGERDNKADRKDVDVTLLHSGYVTVTPIGLDMTDYATLERLNNIIISTKAGIRRPQSGGK